MGVGWGAAGGIDEMLGRVGSVTGHVSQSVKQISMGAGFY